jgi:hypothetical protein
LHLRADDGIRTRDPHLGKVMRYQLRYVRAPRTRSSPGAKHDDSARDRTHTNPLVPCVLRLARVQAIRTWRVLRTPARASLRRRSPLGAGPVAQWKSVRFTRGRSLVRSQPGPQTSVQVVGSDVSLDTTHGRGFGPFMRPICGQVADWPHGGRSHATSRRRTSSGRFSNERLSGDDCSGVVQRQPLAGGPENRMVSGQAWAPGGAGWCCAGWY